MYLDVEVSKGDFMSRSDGLIDLRAVGIYAALATTGECHGARALSDGFNSTRFFCEEGLRDLRRANVIHSKIFKFYDRLRTVNTFISPEGWDKEKIPEQNLTILLSLYEKFLLKKFESAADDFEEVL